MPDTTINTADIINRYADDIAYVAESDAAIDLETFADQAGRATRNFSLARINGHEDVETAAEHLLEAHLATDATERDVFIRKADKLLRPILADMTQEYREMVGD